MPRPTVRFACGIHVDAEHPISALGERTAEIDGAGRLADAALLVRDRNYLGQRVTFVRLGAGSIAESRPVDDRPTRAPRSIRVIHNVEKMAMSLCKDIRLYSKLSTIVPAGP